MIIDTFPEFQKKVEKERWMAGIHTEISRAL